MPGSPRIDQLVPTKLTGPAAAYLDARRQLAEAHAAGDRSLSLSARADMVDAFAVIRARLLERPRGGRTGFAYRKIYFGLRRPDRTRLIITSQSGAPSLPPIPREETSFALSE